MGRPSIGKRAMTPAERQRRRRKKLKKEQSTEVRRKLRLQQREEYAKKYIPVPPGITRWTKVIVTTASGPCEIWTPQTKPLAVCEEALEPEDVEHLLHRLIRLARWRGIDAASICAEALESELPSREHWMVGAR